MSFPDRTLPEAGDSGFKTLQKLLLLLNQGLPATLVAPLAALANNTVSDLDFSNVTASFKAGPLLRSNAGGVRVFANGAALLAATPEYAGQPMIALDGAFSIPRTAATGHSADPIVVLASLVTFEGAIKPNRIDAVSTSPQFEFPGGAHRLSASGTFQDNTLILENKTTGGFAAVTLSKNRGYPEATFGTAGSNVPGSEYNSAYLATSTPDGIITPIPIGFWQEEPVGGRTHRRIWCDYPSKTVKCYGLDTAGAIVGGSDILVTDPVGWTVYDNGAFGISSLAPANASSTGVAGTITWAAGFLYVCTATNVWKRAALATW